MLPRLETSKVIRRATKIFQEHNDNCPIVKHIRKTSQGDQEISRRKGKIPESVTTTFHAIISDYIHNYNFWRMKLPAELQDPENLTPVWTNSARIGKIAGCEARTVRNHVTRLKKMGLVQTKFHGSKKSFELWVDAKLLFEFHSEKPVSGLETAILDEHQRKNFPDNSYTRDTLKKETDNAAVHVLQGHDKKQGHAERTDQFEVPLKAAPDGHGDTSSAAAAGVSQARPAPRERQNTNAEGDEFGKPSMPPGLDGKPLRIEFACMIAEFWIYAQKLIYPGKIFNKHQHEKALVAIRDGVYRGFQDVFSEAEMERRHLFQMEKIYKAGKYLDTHPEAFAPFPYGVHDSGKGYFDRENLRGFAGLDKWIFQDRKRRKEQARERKLRQARRDFEAQSTGRRPRKEVAGLNMLGLFNHYQSIFGSYGHKWEQKFNNQFEAQRARKFLPVTQEVGRKYAPN